MEERANAPERGAQALREAHGPSSRDREPPHPRLLRKQPRAEHLLQPKPDQKNRAQNHLTPHKRLLERREPLHAHTPRKTTPPRATDDQLMSVVLQNSNIV